MNLNPYEPPGCDAEPIDSPAPGKIWIQIDQEWIARVQSPYYLLIAALTGVSISFAPLALLMLGGMKLQPIYHWSIASVCFAMILLVPGWYMRLAGEVLKELHKKRIGR